MVFVAGQIGWDTAGAFPNGFAAQFRRTIDNTLAALCDIGAAWRERIGAHYPAMAVVEVKGLIEDVARVEIETTAVLP